MKKNDTNNITVWTRFQPYSVDPLDYDYDVHHLVMRSVFASLVSIYGEGEVTPQLAKSWSHAENFSQWSLELDTTWTFSNGEVVSPEIILRNFKRIIFLKNKTNSKSGLLEHLKGFNDFNSINDSIQGLSLDKNKLTFLFVKPMPDFLEKISFGLYGIAHPADYDSDGKWINPKKAITSGKYRISEWQSDHIIISLNSNLGKEENYKNIKFQSSKNLNDIRKSDIIFADMNNPYVNKDEWNYISKTQKNSILYIQVMNWDDPNSYFFNKKNREAFRDLYYSELEQVGYKVTRSFFPLEINEVKEFSSTNASSNIFLEPKEIRTQHFFYNEDFFKVGVIERGKIFKDSIEAFANNRKFKMAYNDYPEKREDEKKVFDIQFLGTSILVDNPRDDIEFMFNSKHGIQLPDENGEITKLLEDKNFSIQKINEKLWDQAIIWPVTHYSSGIWINKKSHINTKFLNSSLHPLDAQFIYKE